MAVAIHQVLATLGYGDAIGHEVLGIQRALRGAGYDVGDLRADGRPAPRRSHGGLPRAARREPSGQHPHPSLLDRIAGLARRLRAPGADGARVPQHHAAGVLRRRAQGARRAMFPRATRAGPLQGPLRPRARRLGIQPPGARRHRLPGDRRAAGGARLLAPGRPGQLHAGRPVRRRLGQRGVCRARDSQQALRGRHPQLPRLQALVQSRARGCSS